MVPPLLKQQSGGSEDVIGVCDGWGKRCEKKSGTERDGWYGCQGKCPEGREVTTHVGNSSGRENRV